MSGDNLVPTDAAAQIGRLLELGLDRAAAELGAARTHAPHHPNPGGSMEPLDQLDQLGPVLAGVVHDIRPDQLGNATPCAGFTVAGVLEHMVTGATAFAAAFAGTEPAPDDTPSDLLGAFPSVLGNLAAAMHTPGALDRTIAAPFGEIDGESFARFVVLDGLVHGWDLSVATGQTYDPPAALVADVAAFAADALDALRDGDTFASPTDPPADATPIERLVAYTGRRVPQPV